MCLSGILIAFMADNQLREFMIENQMRTKIGKEKIPILKTGLWKYSRHPNYFGEQLWWWSFALFSVQVNQSWAIFGTLFNSIVLAIVTKMTEDKMLREWPKSRALKFQKYQETTSACIPWFSGEE